MKRRATSTKETVQRPSLRRGTRSNPPIATGRTSDTSTSSTTGSVKSVSSLGAIPETAIDVDNYTLSTKSRLSSNKKLKNNNDKKTTHDFSQKLPTDLSTPKGKRVVIHQKNDQTPFKDDLLTCSQTDSQSDVNWDCTSPDALRYLRRGRRRRNDSDVSEIVSQLLVASEEDEQEDTQSANTPPLLGLWMNGSTRAEVQLQRTLGPVGKLNRFKKKDKSHSSRGLGGCMPQDLIEKLKQSVNKGDEDQEGSEPVTHRETEVSISQHSNLSQKFDQSRDLFEGTQHNPVTANQAKLWKEASTSGNDDKTVTVENANDSNVSDTSWSDEDIFNDESFLIKATQGTGSRTPVNLRGQKRKSEVYDGPQTKTGKFQVNQKAPVHQALTTGKQQYKFAGQKNDKPVVDSKPTNVPCTSIRSGTSDQKNSLPFRRYKSFDEKCSSFTGGQKTQKAQKLPSTGLNEMGKASSLQNSKVDNRSRATTQQNNSVVSTNVTDSKTLKTGGNKSLYRTKSFPDPEALAGSQVRNCQTETRLNSNLTDHREMAHPTSAYSGNSHTTRSGKYVPFVSQASSRSIPVKKISDSCEQNVTKEQNVAKLPFGSLNKLTNNKKSDINYVKCDNKKMNNVVTEDSTKSKFDVNIDCSAKNNKTTIASPTTSSRRRSSGIFDTSLSDDILCQLAEPDEILDSQASPKGVNTKCCEKVGASIVPRKPVKTDVSQSITSKSPEVDKNNLKCTLNSEKQPFPPQLLNTAVNNETNRQSKQSSIGSVKYKTYHQSMIEPKVGALGSKSYQFKNTSKQSESVNKNTASGCQSSLQQHKYKFKSSQMMGTASSSVKDSGTMKPKASCTSVTGPQASKINTTKQADSVNDSEDLFGSDGEDILSEEHILAMLDTVELEATQVASKSCSEKQQTEKEMEHCTVKQNLVNSLKCSSGEIEKKRKAALERRQKKSLVSTNNISSSQSPIKCSPEEIEKKRQAALRKRNKSETSSIGSVSPVKCSQEEIEEKRQRALERKKKPNLVGSPGEIACGIKSYISPQKDDKLQKRECDTSPVFLSSYSEDSCSPFKCTPDEIEKKKQAALIKRQEKLKVKGNLNEHFSSDKFQSGGYPRR